MNNYQDLKKALLEIAKEKRDKRDYRVGDILFKSNARVIQILSQPNDVYKKRGSRVINITRLILQRVDRRLQKSGLDWQDLDWKTVKTWLIENWAQILKLILTLFVFI